MSRNAVPRILNAAIEIAASDTGQRLTLESVATRAGLTKPGLMYHFPSKRALEVGIVNFLVNLWISQMSEFLECDLDQATPREKILAYITAATSENYDRGDFKIYGIAARSTELRKIWNEKMEEWIGIPDDVDDRLRARWTMARLAADGYWATTAAELLTPSPRDRELARELLLEFFANSENELASAPV